MREKCERKKQIHVCRYQCGYGFTRNDDFLFYGRPDQCKYKLKVGRDEQYGESSHRPIERRTRQQYPTQKEQKECGGLNQTSAQVVDDLPLRNDGDRVADFSPGLIRNDGQHPSGYLPITTQPAMLAPIVSTVMRRIIFDNFDVTY